jgi:hypothetical protein
VASGLWYNFLNWHLLRQRWKSFLRALHNVCFFLPRRWRTCCWASSFYF